MGAHDSHAPASPGPIRSGLRLRPITDGDLPFLRALYGSTREEELAPVAWTPEQKEAFLDQQFHAQHAQYMSAYEHPSFAVVEVDGEPAGRLYVDRRPTELLVVDIAFLPAFRGRGIGTLLLEGLIAEAEATSIPVTMHVERNNPVIRLYARLGFRLVEDRGVYLFIARQPAPGG
ncbi:MAG: GNAT family N-acetyltransferase [Dehalococcoidia bacterium]